MKVIVLASGRLREKYTKLGAELYIKRLTKMIPFEMIEVAESKGATADQTGLRLASKLKDTDRVILMAEDGRQFSSVGFAEFLGKAHNAGPGRMMFVVGGPYGAGKAVADRANEKMSLGAMTLPHELARVVLLEQLYRATSILQGGSYHHGSDS